MALRTCMHWNCDTVMKKRGQTCCGRHWYSLPEEMRNRHKYATTDGARLAIKVEMRQFFDEHRLGDHEVVCCHVAGCPGKFVYLPTRRGNRCPTDVATMNPDDALFDKERHVSHFASCKEPDEFRRPR